MTSNDGARGLHGLGHAMHPTGWYQLGWSPEFEAETPVPLKVFGRDLAVYRTADGDLVALDGHCLHMGAHLAHGGEVVGDCIRCPFHGWEWGPDGANVKIPGAERTNRAKRLGGWSIRENSGIVMVWYDAEGSPPTWEPEIFVPVDDFHPTFPHTTGSWELPLAPQLVAENAVDSAHFEFVHRSASTPQILEVIEAGPVLRVRQSIVYGGNRKKTWLTPEGPVEGELDIVLWGLAISVTKFSGSDDAYTLVATTPLDDEMSVFRMTNWVPRTVEPALVERRTAEQRKQAERDIQIWRNLEYVQRPPFTRDEAAHYRTLRSWAHQFYPEAVATG